MMKTRIVLSILAVSLLPLAAGILPALAASPSTAAPLAVEAGYRFQSGIAEGSTLVALITADVEVYRNPGDDQAFMVQKGVSVIGNTTVLVAVAEPVDGWVEVMLPKRPNGSTGWIRTDDDVHFYVAGGKIVIDLSDRELVYHQDGVEMFRATVAIGTARNPTPTGTFFVTDNVRVSRSGGPFGPYALALSGRSDTISEFNGGDGIIGIHGTNRPETIGTSASLGCVRLRNQHVTRLAAMVPVGTPVEIRP